MPSDFRRPADVLALLRFRDEFELGDGLFREITGLEVSQLFAYRRGKLKERPQISNEALARIDRCHVALQLAMELTNDEEKALDWIYADSAGFHGKCPIDMTIDAVGLGVLQNYINQLRVAVKAATEKQNASTNSPSPPLATPAMSAVGLRLEKPQRKAEALAASIPPRASGAPRRPLEPPSGVSPGERVFRLKEPLAKIRTNRPELSLKEIASLMVERGFKQFESSSYMSRISNSYAWATWEEVLAMADALQVDPRELGSVWTKF